MTIPQKVRLVADAQHALNVAVTYARSADAYAEGGADLIATSDRIRAAEWQAEAERLYAQAGYPVGTDCLDLITLDVETGWAVAR